MFTMLAAAETGNALAETLQFLILAALIAWMVHKL